jgi:hypothetical protein
MKSYKHIKQNDASVFCGDAIQIFENGSSGDDKQTPWFISLRFEARRALEGR